MIFVDANIPMYVAGAPHPHKDTARRMLVEAVRDEQRLVTSAEVFQEILCRRSTAYDQRFPPARAAGPAELSLSIQPCAASVPAAVGGPLRIHSKTTPMRAPTTGPTT